MSNIAVRVEGLGKLYRIGGQQEQYATLRDTLTDLCAAPFRRARSLLRGEAYGAADLKQEIWALRDLSFEVQHGEVLGIIGRNGAGKSTLLKILSRITEPTRGCADVFGRIGSLLEVGTGFHPELTGRENVYLNGAILGMSREEIRRKFDEIVAFAEVEKFIDTPVKHYSSGMGLRLGFAVAAHLEPEILVVDEVLAVGDVAFQKKCLGKMSEVAGQGRTVLFVSHNMAAVNSLCSRGLLLESGSLAALDSAPSVIFQYQQSMNDQRTGGKAHQAVDFTDVRLNGQRACPVNAARPLEVQVTLASRITVDAYYLFCIVHNAEDATVIHARTDSANVLGPLEPGERTIGIRFPPLWLRPGVYTLEFKLFARATARASGRYLSDPIMFEVLGNDDPGQLPGLLTPDVEWAVLEPVAGEGVAP